MQLYLSLRILMVVGSATARGPPIIDMTLVPYLNTLFDDVTFDNGPISRAGIKQSKYAVNVGRLMNALLANAWEPEEFAKEILLELDKCATITTLGVFTRTPNDWVNMVKARCTQPSKELDSLRQLGVHYLTHLVMTFWSPGRKTPQTTVDPSANLSRAEVIQVLLEQTKVGRNQSALTKLVYSRDGFQCLITKSQFKGENSYTPRCSYILPFLLCQKSETHIAIESFTHMKITSEFILDNVDDPRNVINLEYNAHEHFDKLNWGIEAVCQEDGTYRYYFREVVEGVITPNFQLRDGDEVIFGTGPGSGLIALPDPGFCNLKLALARVLHASGAAEAIDAFERDYEDMVPFQPIHFGSNNVSDDLLMESLFARLTHAPTPL